MTTKNTNPDFDYDRAYKNFFRHPDPRRIAENKALTSLLAPILSNLISLRTLSEHWQEAHLQRDPLDAVEEFAMLLSNAPDAPEGFGDAMLAVYAAACRLRNRPDKSAN